MKYWQAALLGFLGAAILFMLLALPATLGIPTQIIILLAMQLFGIGIGLATVLIHRRREHEQFDLLPTLGQRMKGRAKAEDCPTRPNRRRSSRNASRSEQSLSLW